MDLLSMAELLAKYIKTQLIRQQETAVIQDIFDGNLLPYVKKAMKDDLSFQSYKEAEARIAPINIMQKLIGKKSKLYVDHPLRSAEKDTKKNKEVISFYEKNSKLNMNGVTANQYFNMFKNTLFGLFTHNGMPRIRAIEDGQYFVYSDDPALPNEPTVIIICYGQAETLNIDLRKKKQNTVEIYHAYSGNQFMIFDSDGDVRHDLMLQMGNVEGINKYGVMPFVYVNRSTSKLIPILDSDMIAMSVLIPILLSDLNFAVKFQSFSIIYGIDLKSDNLTFAPNAFWQMQSDPKKETTPSVGMLKPEVDIDASLGLIQAQVSMWLTTQGVKVGSLGSGDMATFASGLSKAVDEMDTTEDRKEQKNFFVPAESEIWRKWEIMQQHDIRDMNLIGVPVMPKDMDVSTVFAEPAILKSRGEMIADQKLEHEAGFTSQKRAIKALNPLMTDTEIDALILEIQEENTIEVDETIEPTEE